MISVDSGTKDNMCPLRSMNGNIYPCTSNCAWWNHHMNECVIMTIGLGQDDN